jgi:hypothetical protein
MNDDHLYLEVTEEVTNGKIDPALWAEAIAKARGDEDKGKYEYINLRVKQIRDAPRQPDSQSGDARYMPPGSIATQPQTDIPENDESAEPFNVVDDEPVVEPSAAFNNAGKDTSIFQKLINGRYGLAKTYWGFWMGIGLIIFILSNVIGTMGMPTFALLWYAGTIAYTAVIWVAIWRASTLYKGPIIWAGLAKTAVVFGVLVTLSQLVSIFDPTY